MTPAEKVVAALEEKPELLKEVIAVLKAKGHVLPHVSPEPGWGPLRLLDALSPKSPRVVIPNQDRCPICHQPSHPHDCR